MNDPQEQRLNELYRNSRREQPSAKLDRRIRKAAKAAVNRRRNRWLWTLSTAAILVLSFTLVIEMSTFEEHSVDIEFMDKPPAATVDGLEKEAQQRKRLNELATAERKSQLLKKSAESMASDRMEEQLVPELNWEPPSEADEAGYDKAIGSVSPAPAHAPSTLVQSKPITLPQASDKRKSPEAKQIVSIPDLPDTLEGLQDLNSSLTGETTSSGRVTLFSGEKLILTMHQQANGIEYMAWSGSEVLGINLDWNMTPAQALSCVEGVVYRHCQLTDDVSAFFDQQRLDHISWTVIDGD
jgi:hypothetical protein